MNDVEAVKQVFPELSLGDHVAEDPVGRRDHAHVHAARGLVRTDLLQLARLEEPQEQPLHPERHLADFVEEDRAVMRELELARAIAIGAGEAAFHVAEQLRFEQRLGHAGAVHGHERACGPRASRVHGVGDQFLARPAFPCNEDLGVGSRDIVDLFLELANDDAVAKQLSGSFISHRRLSTAPSQGRATPVRDRFRIAGKPRLLRCGPTRLVQTGRHLTLFVCLPNLKDSASNCATSASERCLVP